MNLALLSDMSLEVSTRFLKICLHSSPDGGLQERNYRGISGRLSHWPKWDENLKLDFISSWLKTRLTSFSFSYLCHHFYLFKFYLLR